MIYPKYDIIVGKFLSLCVCVCPCVCVHVGVVRLRFIGIHSQVGHTGGKMCVWSGETDGKSLSIIAPTPWLSFACCKLPPSTLREV